MRQRNLERVKWVKSQLERESQLYRSAGAERIMIGLFAYAQNIDILSGIDTLGYRTNGWIWRILSPKSTKPLEPAVGADEILEMEALELFLDPVFMNWFLNHRDKYPKMAHCVVILEHARRELIEIMQDEYGKGKYPCEKALHNDTSLWD